MNFKHLCAFALLCVCTINSLSAQNDIVSKAMLLISYQKAENANQRGQINLAGEAAYQFDVADFLSKNKYEDIQINGWATVNYEKLTWKFSSNDFTETTHCGQFSQVVTGTEKVPFLGVSVLAMDDFSGVQVVEIIEGSAAEIYHFQIGDILTSVNDYEIYTPCDLTAEIGQTPLDDLLTVELIRGNENLTLQPKLGYHLRKHLSWKPDCEKSAIVLENVPTNNLQYADLSVSPNPTNGKAQVNYTSSDTDAVQMTVTDLTGKVILSKNLLAFPGFYNDVIDLTAQPEGIYFLNITQGQEVRTEKVVLQKR